MKKKIFILHCHVKTDEITKTWRLYCRIMSELNQILFLLITPDGCSNINK